MKNDETMGDVETKRAEGGAVLAGRYRVVGRLGEGGMGLRWVCWKWQQSVSLGLVLALGIVQLFLLAGVIATWL